ncbi:MAG TPA: SDR family oxidoreductase [Tepidisphaeraceae bacterium]|jgi:NAD(P)-dependent dehydrogenase (short-subunit alcohol dehydrogenase family)
MKDQTQISPSSHVLHGRVALIYGAGAGLGRAIARAYAREGASLVLADLNAEAARETLELAEQSKSGLSLPVDVSDPAASADAVEQTVRRMGKLHIMVNCAAICFVDPLLEVTPQRWDKVFSVNTRGAFFAIQSAAKAMIPGHFGRIISISTPASRMGFPNFASYAASKAALDSMTKSAAVALGEHGITVNTIVPGRMTGGMIEALERDLQKISGKSQEQLKEERTKGLPIPRRVEPSEVAEAAVWLASDAAAYVNAERFNFTGGMELS